MAYGLVEATLCLAVLAQRFDPTLEPGTEVRPVCRLTLRPGRRLPMRLGRRPAPAVPVELGPTPA
jgi:cytochrome P450